MKTGAGGTVATAPTTRFDDLKPIEGLKGPYDLRVEHYREYDFPSGRVYRISDPLALFFRDGGTTHRVVDSQGVVHCIPYGPATPDVVLRWANRAPGEPVNF